MAALTGLLLLAVLAAAQSPPPLPRQCCARDAACWPSAAEISSLSASLDPSAERRLVWAGPGAPYPGAFPVSAEQPLFGAGEALKPLYVDERGDQEARCLQAEEALFEFCKVAARNNPLEAWAPALVAWPLSEQHVQTLVAFAAKHELCVCVAGTGHDFLNRHSCPDGLLIRTSLLKALDWDLSDARGFGHASGTVRVGAGIVFHELHEAASKVGRAMASGWSPTVGIAGWTLGGGHGPYVPMFGLGADQLVEATLVTANASVVTANIFGTTAVAPDGTVTRSNNTDLIWALRGGGGSAWGVVTAFTVKAHALPERGFTKAQISWGGLLCTGNDTLSTLIDGYLAWALELDSNWGGLVFTQPSVIDPQIPGACGISWYVYVQYLYRGAPSDAAFANTWARLSSLARGSEQIRQGATVWELLRDDPPESILTLPYLPATDASLGGLPSVLVDHDRVASGQMGAFIKRRFNDCLVSQVCPRQELYHDITGQRGSPQEPFAAVNPGLRSAMFHYLSYGWPSTLFNEFYALGNYSYLSESAYNMPDWRARLWGEANYARLAQIKKSTDPDNLFYCHHCVGDLSS